mgnify:CR=1 FL=1
MSYSNEHKVSYIFTANNDDYDFKKVDGTLLVILANKTKKGLVKNAKELLNKVNANILGVILNGKETEPKEYYGYYINK